MKAWTSSSTRLPAPELPSGKIAVQAPPDTVESQGIGNVLVSVLPMMGGMGVMVFMAMSQGNNPRMLLMSGGMITAMLAMLGFNIYRQISQHRNAVVSSRREYLAYLTEVRKTIRQAAVMQRRHETWNLPDPTALALIAEEGSRLWERHADDEDLLATRIGRATRDICMPLEEPELQPLAKPDPVCLSAMNRFVAVHSVVDDLPLAVSLNDYCKIEVVGPKDATQAQVRAMICQLACFISPHLLQVAILTSDQNLSQWDWVKWLPHARSSEAEDAVGPVRMVGADLSEIMDLLPGGLYERPRFSARNSTAPLPHVLIVLDGVQIPELSTYSWITNTQGVTVIDLPDTWEELELPSILRLTIHPPSKLNQALAMERVSLEEPMQIVSADSLALTEAEATARRMCAIDLSETSKTVVPAGKPDPKRTAELTDLLEIGDIRDYVPEEYWGRRVGADRLRVPFGVTPEGAPVSLDIKESAHQGMGPHGLLIGATGSGKSEVLRTLVLGLVLTHSPEELNLVLVDFKGGATFAGMSELPHVSATITNLESELFLVDRMQDALRGEMTRRQELLREAGNFSNVTDYEAARLAGKHSLVPLPSLFIVLDEFSEMLSAKPEFADLFTAIGRLGRSMQIHLLLSSQRLEQGRLHGLDSHLSYRIGLRTFSASESREVLGVPDAYDLPSLPGVGYLQADTRNMIRFRASYVAGPLGPRRVKSRAANASPASQKAIEILPFTLAPVLKRAEAQVEEIKEVSVEPLDMPHDAQYKGMSTMDIAISRMIGHGTPAHQVWLPPLEIPETFDSLMPDLIEDPVLGLSSASWRNFGTLKVPLGIVDIPLEQRRDNLVIDLSGAGGHLAIIGAAQSGKSTALRSLVIALSLVNTPQEAQFYILDFGGGAFAPFSEMAHVSGVASRDQPDVVSRIIAEVKSIIDDREIYFREHKIDSIDTYRQGRAAGRFDDGYGDVFLIIDSWATLRAEFDHFETPLHSLAARGLTFGVHMVVSTVRWMDFRSQIHDSFGSKFELRLGDPAASNVNRKSAELIPPGVPGRGIEIEGRQVLLALPRVDGDHDPKTLGAGVNKTIDRINAAWNGAEPPKLRLLPDRIDLENIRKQAPENKHLILGIDEARLAPRSLDPTFDSHLYLLGDAKSGKSTFLRTVTKEITRLYTPEEAKIFALDLRRSLLGEIPEDYLAAYLASREDATSQLAELAAYLETRLPGPEVTAEALRSRSWWTGAEVFVLVDDYDLVVSSTGNPLGVLQPLLAQAQDIGLHLILTRRSGGATRAFYEPILQTLSDLAVPGMLLSGNPEEGALIGKIKPMISPPGRAQLITRERGHEILQLAFTELTETS